MQVEDVQLLSRGGRRRLTAHVKRTQGDAEVFFEVPADCGDLLADTPDAFLPIVAVLASMAGEETVTAERACPVLAEGVRTVLEWLRLWYPDAVHPVTVEVSGHGPRSPSQRVAGSLLSGGIDSLAILRANHLRLPIEHPSRIQVCALVNWNVGSERDVDRRAFESVEAKRRQLEPFAAGAGVRFVPVYSNVLSLADYPRAPWWGKAIHGAAFASAAHALSGGLHTVHIASSHDLPDLEPLGSHPLIDTNLSSGYLRFVNEGLRLSRLAETAIVADWQEALDIVSVCINRYEVRAREGNCGRCEKCIRTSLALLALGKLDKARTFKADSITPHELHNIPISHDVALYWAELVYGLRANGFLDLASAVEGKLKALERRRRLASLDDRMTGGMVQRLNRRVR